MDEKVKITAECSEMGVVVKDIASGCALVEYEGIDAIVPVPRRPDPTFAYDLRDRLASRAKRGQFDLMREISAAKHPAIQGAKIHSADIEPGRSGDHVLVINGQAAASFASLQKAIAVRQVMLGYDYTEGPER